MYRRGLSVAVVVLGKFPKRVGIRPVTSDMVIYLTDLSLGIITFFIAGPPKEDIFLDHLLWSIFQSVLHVNELLVR